MFTYILPILPTIGGASLITKPVLFSFFVRFFSFKKNDFKYTSNNGTCNKY